MLYYNNLRISEVEVVDAQLTEIKKDTKTADPLEVTEKKKKNNSFTWKHIKRLVDSETHL